MSSEQKVEPGGDLAYWEPTESTREIENGVKWQPGDPIGYIRPEIPQFDVPLYEGQRYEALVPDTLDLQARAALAVHGLTGPTNPLADYEVYFFAYFHSNPVMMQHSSDSHCMNKFMEALPLLRIMSGSQDAEQVDRRWMEVLLHQIGPDGLAYLPTKGRPWALLGIERLLPPHAKDREQFISPIHCGRLLSALTLYDQRDGGGLWRETAERLVDALADVAVDRGDYAYFAPHPYWAEKGSTADPAHRATHTGLEVRGAVLGLTHLYRATGYEPARDFAKKLVHYMLHVCQGFDEDGRFNASLYSEGDDAGYQVQMPDARHFHLHSYALQSILEYGSVTGDAELMELARKGYLYGKSQGNDLLGYFPEFVNSPRMEHSELCEVADMIALGLKLTDAGLGDYWDDADRWARNMFAEGQLTHTDWINRLHVAGMEGTREVDVLPSHINPIYQTTERVAERNLGCFAGWPKANDWYAGQGMGIMHCCTGNAARALYYLWDHILTQENGRLSVNLLLNRASPWADIDSYIPYKGQVDVKVKQPLNLAMRIPEWVRAGDVRCEVAGGARDLGWEGRYAKVGSVKPGDRVSLIFPIAERTDVVYVEKERYTLVRKGNEVVSIDPPGKYCPLYQRAHYRVDAPRWRKMERFVSDESIHW